jgi:hypothetical protein
VLALLFTRPLPAENAKVLIVLIPTVLAVRGAQNVIDKWKESRDG